MILIHHRRNTSKELQETAYNYGVEVDIRTYKNRLILHHEPLVKGELFEDWIAEYHHKTLILNVKEEGLETLLLKIIHARGIEDFFFLDQSFPFLIKTSAMGEPRCAIRLSEYESIQTVLTLKHMVQWVWVDCFTHFPLTNESMNLLKAADFKLCLVSPELQGRDPHSEIQEIRHILETFEHQADAVCTKHPTLWA